MNQAASMRAPFHLSVNEEETNTSGNSDMYQIKYCNNRTSSTLMLVDMSFSIFKLPQQHQLTCTVQTLLKMTNDRVCRNRQNTKSRGLREYQMAHQTKSKTCGKKANNATKDEAAGVEDARDVADVEKNGARSSSWTAER